MKGKGEPALYPEYTARFANAPGTYGIDSRDPDWELSSMSLVGIIIGAVFTLGFVLFAVANIIIDETARHKEFENRVEKAKEQLR